MADEQPSSLKRSRDTSPERAQKVVKFTEKSDLSLFDSDEEMFELFWNIVIDAVFRRVGTFVHNLVTKFWSPYIIFSNDELHMIYSVGIYKSATTRVFSIIEPKYV